MPTSAAGNKPALALRTRASDRASRTPGGFSLIELIVVVALIAVASAGVTLSMRDSAADALERDAQRLAAVLESARAQSRANGALVTWQTHTGGFLLQGLFRPQVAQSWLSDHTRVQPGAPVVLGPEPLIPAQSIGLTSTTSTSPAWWVVSDGLRPFQAQRTPEWTTR